MSSWRARQARRENEKEKVLLTYSLEVANLSVPKTCHDMLGNFSWSQARGGHWVERILCL